MQNWKEFLEENYEITEEEFESLGIYERRIIEKEYEEQFK